MPWLSSTHSRQRGQASEHCVPGVSCKVSGAAEGPWLDLGDPRGYSTLQCLRAYLWILIAAALHGPLARGGLHLTVEDSKAWEGGCPTQYSSRAGPETQVS